MKQRVNKNFQTRINLKNVKHVKQLSLDTYVTY